MRRSWFAFAFAAVLLAGPVSAQSYDEMTGVYRVRVEPEPGSLCPPGEANFEVLGFDGNAIHVVLDGTRTTGQWDRETNSFSATIPFPDDANLIRMSGGFQRLPDRVDLAVMVDFPPARPCKALLSGSRPAGPIPPTPGPTPIAPSPTAPPVFGVSPQPVPPDGPPLGPTHADGPGQPPLELLLRQRLFGMDIKVLAAAAIVVLLIGAGLSLRKKPPAPDKES